MKLSKIGNFSTKLKVNEMLLFEGTDIVVINTSKKAVRFLVQAPVEIKINRRMKIP